MSEELTPEFSPEEAFVSAAAGSELFGAPLRKFSFSRKLAAQQMGCKAPALGGGDQESMRTTGLYPGGLNDAIIVLWLCTIKDPSELTVDEYRAGEFTPERAINQPVEANAKARAWAELHELENMASPQFFEAWKTFLTLMFQIEASAFEPDVEKTGEPTKEQAGPKEKPGHPNKRDSSRGLVGSAGKPSRASGQK